MIELINFNVTEKYIAIGFYKNDATQLISVPLSDFEKWATDNNRMIYLIEVKDDEANVIDHDEIPIPFEQYLEGLDKKEVLYFLQNRQ
jgi:hypothetical protein